MTKKERIEDLGRIAVMLDHLREHDLFGLYDDAPNRFDEWWINQTPDEQKEFLHNIAYGIDEVYSKICDIGCIADGDDE